MQKSVALVWNPTMQKSVAIDEPPHKMFYDPFEYVIAFGVNPDSLDPVLVTISNRFQMNPREGKIYTLSSRVWRSLRSNLPRNSICIKGSQINIDEFIYWLAYDQQRPLIVSFDIRSEEFSEAYLPVGLIKSDLCISKLQGSLVVLDNNHLTDAHVWMMNKGDPDTFTNIFTVNTPDAIINRVLGFRKSGEHVTEIKKHYKEREAELFACEPNSRNINFIGITGQEHSFTVSSYMETLLLIDH